MTIGKKKRIILIILIIVFIFVIVFLALGKERSLTSLRMVLNFVTTGSLYSEIETIEKIFTEGIPSVKVVRTISPPVFTDVKNCSYTDDPNYDDDWNWGARLSYCDWSTTTKLKIISNQKIIGIQEMFSSDFYYGPFSHTSAPIKSWNINPWFSMVAQKEPKPNEWYHSWLIADPNNTINAEITYTAGLPPTSGASGYFHYSSAEGNSIQTPIEGDTTVPSMITGCIKYADYFYVYDSQNKKVWKTKEPLAAGSLQNSDSVTWTQGPDFPGLTPKIEKPVKLYDTDMRKAIFIFNSEGNATELYQLSSNKTGTGSNWQKITCLGGGFCPLNDKIDSIAVGQNYAITFGREIYSTQAPYTCSFCEWFALKDPLPLISHDGEFFNGTPYVLAHDYQTSPPHATIGGVPCAILNYTQGWPWPFGYDSTKWSCAMTACPAGSTSCADKDIKDITDTADALGVFKNQLYVSIGRPGNPDTPWIYRSASGGQGTWGMVFEPSDFVGAKESFYNLQTLFKYEAVEKEIILAITSSGVSYYSKTGNKGDWRKINGPRLEPDRRPIRENEGVAYATSPDDNQLYYSVDGIDWQKVPSSFKERGKNIEVIGAITECEESKPNNPTVANLRSQVINLCCYSPITKLSWDYSDLDGDPQKIYQIQVLKEGEIVFDSGEKNDSTTQRDLVNLDFDSEYSWRIKVWDDRDGESSWTTASSNFTIPQRGPTIEFRCDNQSCENLTFRVKKGEDTPIQFCSTAEEGTRCLEDLIFCYSEPCTWKWDFDYEGVMDSPDSNEKNPLYTYHSGSKSTYIIRLEVTGNDNRTCSTEHTIRIMTVSPFLEWREILPF